MTLDSILIHTGSVRSHTEKHMQALGTNQDSGEAVKSEALRAVAYSMDMLFPGLYVWLGNHALRVGGQTPDDQPYRYPGQINSLWGIALVLPGYRIFTTYNQSYDAGQA